jgi:hypothetical protein
MDPIGFELQTFCTVVSCPGFVSCALIFSCLMCTDLPDRPHYDLDTKNVDISFKYISVYPKPT